MRALHLIVMFFFFSLKIFPVCQWFLIHMAILLRQSWYQLHTSSCRSCCVEDGYCSITWIHSAHLKWQNGYSRSCVVTQISISSTHVFKSFGSCWKQLQRQMYIQHSALRGCHDEKIMFSFSLITDFFYGPKATYKAYLVCRMTTNFQSKKILCCTQNYM